jgi:Mrp family chromosome partitioning ATPase
MSSALEEHLFTGRERERATFRRWPVDDAAPPTILTVSGPGGVGKSALLRAFSRIASELGRPVLLADGRAFPATPEGLLSALAGARAEDVLG